MIKYTLFTSSDYYITFTWSFKWRQNDTDIKEIHLVSNMTLKEEGKKSGDPPPSLLPAIFYMMCSTHPNAHTQLALVLIGTAVGLMLQSSLTKISAAFRIENDCC